MPGYKVHGYAPQSENAEVCILVLVPKCKFRLLLKFGPKPQPLWIIPPNKTVDGTGGRVNQVSGGKSTTRGGDRHN